MNKLKKILLASLLLLVPLTVGTLAGCSTSDTSTTSVVTIDDPNELVPTPLTDALEFPFEEDYATKDFAEANVTGIVYGRVILTYATDGDTASFRTMGSGTRIRLRFLGVDTPESTAQVEPWGVKASAFTKDKLQNAKNICLVNDVKTNAADSMGYERTETSGRYLGFVWYQTQDDDWRLLNLELIEQCYSLNQLFTDSDLGYLQYFLEASATAVASGIRVNGTRDPDYDYSNDVQTVTINYLRENYDALGIDIETGSSGIQLRVTGMVVGLIGDNMILRDISRGENQEDDEPYSTIYAYAGYNSGIGSMVDIGDVVSFYCRASVYPTGSQNIQLTDVISKTYGDQKFEVVAKYQSDDWYALVPDDCDIEPVIPESNPTTKDELATYSGYFVQMEITIRLTEKGEFDDDGTWVGTGEESYYNRGSTGGLTVYAYLRDTRVVCNLRIDNSCFPSLNEYDFGVGRTFRAQGYLQPYYDNYQLQMFNYTNSAYLQEIVDETENSETTETEESYRFASSSLTALS